MLSSLYVKVKKFFTELNLFRNPAVKNNRHQIRNQTISTRVFICLFSIITFVFLIYLLLIRTTNFVTTEKPDQLLFKELSIKYNDTLKCPCSNLSIPYRTFISLRTTYHPICSLNLELIIHRLFNYTESLSNEKDFRFTGALQLRLLTLLCSSVDEMIRARLTDFNATLFTNLLLLRESDLKDQVEELIKQFIQIVTRHFLNSLKMDRIYTFGNQFISGVRSNYKIISQRYMPLTYHVVLWSYPQTYDGLCNCSTSYLCSSPALIYENNQAYNVDGFRISCFIVESLLASSLECFYNTSCLSQFLQHIQLNTTFVVEPSTKFNKRDIIEMILNELMVEQWHNSTNYKAYFNACEAKTCSYSYEGRRSWYIILTTILSFVSGLETVLLFIIPIFVAFLRKKRRAQTTINHSMIRRFRRHITWQKLIKQIRLINLYKSPDSRTELDIRNEFFSTRIYVLFLIIISSLLMQYYSLLINPITVTIETPTLDKIVNMNESSLVCPCSRTSIPYKRFLSIEPIFHPICSSNFIDDKLLNTFNTTDNNDVRNLQLRFRLLSLFCQFTRQIIQFELGQLNNSYIFNSQLLSKSQVETQINVTVEQTMTMASSTFASSLQLLVDTSNINKLLSADDRFQPSGAWVYQPSPVEFLNPVYIAWPCTLRDSLDNITIDQFYINCNSMQALLASSFVSFYNQTILQSLNHFIVNRSIRPLNHPIIVPKNATILSILNRLMIDTYIMDFSYESYFNQCHPQRCTYRKMSRESIIDIFITTIGFVGGFTGILHFIIRHTVRLIRRPTRINIENIQQNKVKRFFLFLRDQLRSLNLFRHSGNSKANEIISTRIFIVLFIIILIILIFYTSLTLTIHTITDNKLNYEKFLSLENQYPLTLVCSCSNLSNIYQKFVSFKPQFHQVCSSIFVDRSFVKLFMTDEMLTFFTKGDLRQYSYYMFLAIQVFCDLSKKTVEEQIDQFLPTKFISYEAMNEEQFNIQINNIIQSMIQTTERETSIQLKLIRDTTYSNQIISNFFSNLNVNNFQIANISIENLTIGLTNKQYGNCNCLTSPSCITPAIDKRPRFPPFTFDGFFIGCYNLESMLRSSMNCLYSQKCINRTVLDRLIRSIRYTTVFPITLNPNFNSSYSINTTFSQLLDHLMVETWGENISHRSYFNSCKPLSCTYSFMSKRDLTYIIAMLSGIIGGVNRLLRLIVPRLVAFIMKKLNRNRINPIVHR